MNQISENGAALRIIRPWSVMAGFVIGFCLLVWSGRTATRHDWHKRFTRFHPMIAPESMYQPTIGEMCAIVRTRCRKDQILVIVGGNSILLGVGQPAERMWTRRLQELLGPKYAVINFAFRGSSATDGGALVAETLRDEYPKQIYIANAAAMQAVSPIGIEAYRFMLLDAYYKGLLLPWKPREDALLDYLHAPANHAARKEAELGARLDAWLHFNDFWNRWSYERFFTFPTDMMPHGDQSYWPRERFADEEPDYDAVPFETRFSPETRAAEIHISSKSTEPFYTKSADGKWEPIKAAHEQFLAYAGDAFPSQLRRRTLILIGRNSPLYTEELPQDVRERDDLAFSACVAGWQSKGYHSAAYGRGFLPSDFGDRSHLTTRGGQKLAAIVAPLVSAMATEMGY